MWVGVRSSKGDRHEITKRQNVALLMIPAIIVMIVFGLATRLSLNCFKGMPDRQTSHRCGAILTLLRLAKKSQSREAECQEIVCLSDIHIVIHYLT